MAKYEYGNNEKEDLKFRKYSDLNKSEKDAYRQGAITAENKIKERMGLRETKEQKEQRKGNR